MLAQAFIAYQEIANVVIFASGVSNSKEECKKNFDREEMLLHKVLGSNKNAMIVYFSTCSVEDETINKLPYVCHKLRMESLVMKHDAFFIFRLPQVVGKTNSPTLARVLFQMILAGKTLQLNKNSTRNLIDVADVVHIVSYLIDNKIYQNEITNIASPFNVNVVDIASRIAEICGKQLGYELLDIGTSYQVDINKILKVKQFSEIFHDNYLSELLVKYQCEYRQ